jgi:hypothetical protein
VPYASLAREKAPMGNHMTGAKDLFDLAEALEKGASAPSVDPPDAVPAAALPGVVREPLTRAEKLQSLTDTALDKTGEIMKLPSVPAVLLGLPASSDGES